MKIKITNVIILSSLIGSLLFLGSGCSKKTVTPPDVGSTNTLSGGTNIEYPPAEYGSGYSENSMNVEGSLDDTGSSTGQDGQTSGVDMVNSANAEPSDQYKMEHGRSSIGLVPIYFDFDQAGIRQDMADEMINNAEFIQQLPQANTIVIEGNCDERGTSEYNIALGERRAINAKDYLVDLGVDANRIRTVGYGEEKPLFTGQDEEAWAQNRRDDFLVE